MVFVARFHNISLTGTAHLQLEEDTFPADSQTCLRPTAAFGQLLTSGARIEQVFGAAPVVNHGLSLLPTVRR